MEGKKYTKAPEVSVAVRSIRHSGTWRAEVRLAYYPRTPERRGAFSHWLSNIDKSEPGWQSSPGAPSELVSPLPFPAAAGSGL